MSKIKTFGQAIQAGFLIEKRGRKWLLMRRNEGNGQTAYVSVPRYGQEEFGGA